MFFHSLFVLRRGQKRSPKKGEREREREVSFFVSLFFGRRRRRRRKMCGVVPSLLSRFDVMKKEKRRTRKLSRDFYARKPKPAFLGHSSVSSSSKDSSLFRTKEKEGNPFTKRGATLVRFSRRRTRSGKDAFGEGTRAPRKARTGTRGRGSEKRARERGRLRGGGEKRKKFLFDLGEIFKERL